MGRGSSSIATASLVLYFIVHIIDTFPEIGLEIPNRYRFHSRYNTRSTVILDEPTYVAHLLLIPVSLPMLMINTMLDPLRPFGGGNTNFQRTRPNFVSKCANEFLKIFKTSLKIRIIIPLSTLYRINKGIKYLNRPIIPLLYYLNSKKLNFKIRQLQIDPPSIHIKKISYSRSFKFRRKVTLYEQLRRRIGKEVMDTVKNTQVTHSGVVRGSKLQKFAREAVNTWLS